MAVSALDLMQEIIRLRAALADTEALEIGTGERLEKVTAQLESEREFHLGWEQQSLVEYSELFQERDALLNALNCENRKFAEANVEIKQLRDAIVTIGDAQAGTSAMELQMFARNVLKGIPECHSLSNGDA
jgi:hypothetical protein